MNKTSGEIRVMRLKMFGYVFSFLFLLSCSHSVPMMYAAPGKSDPTRAGTVIYQKDQMEADRTVDDPGGFLLVSSVESSKVASQETVKGPVQGASEGQKARVKAIIRENKLQTNAENNEKIGSEAEGNGQETLDIALDMLSQARSLWQKGDVDDALKMLDEAYTLIVEVNGDPELSRQKDDLRLLISRMIVQISASRGTEVTGMRSEIPMIMNADVEKEIRSFQTVERGFFLRSYHRSGIYLATIRKQLKEAGLPQELAWLPLVESGFQVRVLSRARALGLWQFIPSTGYKYDLMRDQWIDERMDVEKSTRAAIHYLKELHNIFGDWLTALASYNCGEGKVLRVISKQHINYLDHFWDLYRQLPHETARYVPRFLATLHIVGNPKKYGMDLSENPDRSVPYEVVQSAKCMKLQDIAQHLDMSQEVLVHLNSELKLQSTPDKGYKLKVPVGKGAKFQSVESQIPRWEPPRQKVSRFVRHRVKKGETVNSIAHRYGVSRQDILAYNKISSKRPMRVGQKIRIPMDGYKSGMKKVAKKGKKAGAVSSADAKKVVYYRVKRGDTLQSIARRNNTTVADLKAHNKIKGNKLVVNQKIRIKGGMDSKSGAATDR